MSSTTDHLPVVVIGAGPVGLAAAAHLIERGVEPLVVEQGDAVGAAVSSWGHVRLFSPWRYDVDAAAVRLLEPTGWRSPDPDTLPTGAELVADYLVPLAALPQVAERLRLGARVIGVTRDGADKTRSLGRDRRPYRVRMITGGQVQDVLARAVVDTSGTWDTTNPVGTGGLPALGEKESVGYLTGPLPDVLGRDRARFAGTHTLVVGMGHSAANTLLALVELAEAEPGTTITWAIRGGSARRLFGGGTDDELPARGLLGSRLKEATDSGRITLVKRASIEQITGEDQRVRVTGRAREEAWEVTVDQIVNATGFRPDLDVVREVRLDLDSAMECPAGLAELIDPNYHSCGTVPAHGEQLLRHPDAGFYIAGMKSYGRAPTFLLATGYEQVRSIAAALAGDAAGATAVELNLPATGVCSTDVAADGEETSCCGTNETPQLLTIGAAPTTGFATGVAHGRSADPA